MTKKLDSKISAVECELKSKKGLLSDNDKVLLDAIIKK